jgi:hypothetical protein
MPTKQQIDRHKRLITNMDNISALTEQAVLATFLEAAEEILVLRLAEGVDTEAESVDRRAEIVAQFQYATNGYRQTLTEILDGLIFDEEDGDV